MGYKFADIREFVPAVNVRDLAVLTHDLPPTKISQ
jgi:hypothetical protein